MRRAVVSNRFESFSVCQYRKLAVEGLGRFRTTA